MSTTSKQVYEDALALPAEARVELTERPVASLADDVRAEISRAQLEELRRRIAQVESGEVALIPGDEALARVRNVLTKHSATAK